ERRSPTKGSSGLPLLPRSRRQRGLRLPLSLERAIPFASRSRSGHGSLPAGRARRFESRPGASLRGGRPQGIFPINI
ncbi:MAG: hypothetical protein IIV56_01990, partial [Mailhella sp.]|nr:hypothetical protein [Mailhella sp.]